MIGRSTISALALVAIGASSLTATAQPATTDVPPAPPALQIRDNAAPRVGNASTIVTTGLVEEITITYSPASKVKTTEVVKPNGTTLVLWRPKFAGVAKISAPGHTDKLVSIRFDGVPLGGVLIMIIAGFILFGGAFMSLRALLAQE